jgi:sugar O-acyltransferase (sialic acid O-acetyltransferase NeuD family)
MKRTPLLVLGAGGHAIACIDVLEAEGKYQVRGLLGAPGEEGKKVLGYPVLGTDEVLAHHLRDCPNVLIGVGQIKTASLRESLFGKARALGAKFPIIRSPFARVSQHACLGEGTIAMHGVTVQPGVRVGQNCILNSHCLLEHGVEISDHCHVSTGAILNGGVRIGRGCFIGSRAVLQEGVEVPDGSVVPMGEVLRRIR